MSARHARLGLVVFLATVLTGTSCSLTTDPGGVFGISATVQFAQVGSGCWTLVASDGTVYEPLDLPEDLQQDGVRVRVWLEEVDNLASTCMVGQIVEITEIRRSSAAAVPADPST